MKALGQHFRFNYDITISKAEKKAALAEHEMEMKYFQAYRARMEPIYQEAQAYVMAHPT
jgi:hypothetical protein